MNNPANSSPELPLPIPSPEFSQGAGEVSAGIESKSPKVDAVSQGPSTPMPMVDPSQFTVATPVASQMSDDQIANASADDEDVIEKEWVSRAKAIVNSTKENPRVQSKELGKFKAEYIKKRFNKDIKTANESVEES